MKITIEIDQEELKELLGLGKEEKQDKYALHFDNLSKALAFIKDANRVIEHYGVISWAYILFTLDPVKYYKCTDKDVAWTKKFVFDECFRTGNLVKMESTDCGIKIIFPKPDKEL